MTPYGERIRKIRNIKNLTQTDFGKRLGITKSTVVNYELGKSKPDIDVTRNIINEFNLNPLWLLEGKEPIFLEETKLISNKDAILDDFISNFYPDISSDDIPQLKRILPQLNDEVIRLEVLQTLLVIRQEYRKYFESKEKPKMKDRNPAIGGR